MGASKQIERLNKLGAWLESKSPLPCAAGLGVRVQRSPHECRKGTDAGDANTFLPPSCVLRPGGTLTVPWPVDSQIDTHGPYDAESFPDKRVKIAVICPEEFVGEAGQFLKQFKDGVPSTDEQARFRQGFVRKYHLNSCDFSFHPVKRNSSSLEEAYKLASFEALKEKPNLAVAVIREQHRELPDPENPYYTTKARLMAQGVPVQLIEIETIRQSGRAFILNNLSVAMYAKLGGIPCRAGARRLPMPPDAGGQGLRTGLRRDIARGCALDLTLEGAFFAPSIVAVRLTSPSRAQRHKSAPKRSRQVALTVARGLGNQG
jgi:hypothetical protein